MSVVAPTVGEPSILHLSILRFRGIKSLSWYPESGVNVLLGGGDVGKTTILDAIGLLLSPTNPATLCDTDYFDRAIAEGFVIEAVVALPADGGIHRQGRSSWPWEWNGKEPIVPSISKPGEATGRPVYRLRVSGNEDFEISHEIVQPDGSTDFLSTSLRRSIGLVRLSGDDRNDRDLRLVSGSALDRLISDKTLRSRLANEVAKSDVSSELSEESKLILQSLDKTFHARHLPEGLDLEITGGQGFSIAALVGLTALRSGVRLPLASWGSGTRRIAALTISEQKQGEAPVTIVDEIERGLEPYRQRSLMDKLQTGKSQVFITTHSPSSLSAASKASLWYVDHSGTVGALKSKEVDRHREYDPETFLARLTVVAEGATEVGFVKEMLERSIGPNLEIYGLHITDGRGHESCLGLLEALSEGGLHFGGFVDDEGKHDTRWKRVAAKLNDLLFRWEQGCLEENIIGAVADDQLEELISDPLDRKTGQRLRTLADRLGTQEKTFDVLRAAAGTGFRDVILAACFGLVPTGKESEKKEYQAHSQIWFKSVTCGRELASKAIDFGVWPTIRSQVMPFVNAVRVAVDLPQKEDL